MYHVIASCKGPHCNHVNRTSQERSLLTHYLHFIVHPWPVKFLMGSVDGNQGMFFAEVLANGRRWTFVFLDALI